MKADMQEMEEIGVRAWTTTAGGQWGGGEASFAKKIRIFQKASSQNKCGGDEKN